MDFHSSHQRIGPARVRHALWSVVLLSSFQSLLGCAETWIHQREPLPTDEATTALAEATVNDSAEREIVDTKKLDGPLSRDSWAHNIAPVDPPGDRKPRHWRHVELETADGQLVIPQDELIQALTSDEKIVAANARLLLIRGGAPSTLDENRPVLLAEIIADATLSAPLRAAAVETLAELSSELSQTKLLALLEAHDRLATTVTPGYAAEVHVELLRRAAEHETPSASPAFARALEAQDPQVRVAAAEIWANSSTSDAPARLIELVSDLDAGVRAAALGALAATRHPLALESARNGLHDPQLEVHLAAIAALGKINDPAATELLRKESAADGNVLRATAVRALAEQGDETAVLNAASDGDSTVRAAAAASLRLINPRRGLATARTLLSDRAMAVRRAAIQSVAAWPLAEAGPLLLEAMSDRALDTRKTAYATLVAQWPAAATFRSSADEAERNVQLAALREQLREGVGTRSQQSGAPIASSDAVVAATLNEIPVERLGELVKALANEADPDRQAAIEELRRASDQLESQLLHWADTQGQVIPESVYEHVLAPRNTVLQQLADWKSLTMLERRQCVGAIAQQSAAAPLTTLAARRLVELVQFAEDPLLWQASLDACREQGDTSVRRFAAAALGHSAPEVRRRACDYFVEHPADDAVAWLMPALADATSYVAAAAARAIGRCGQPTDLRPFVALSGHADADCRLAAAVTLSRWHDERGYAALERLAFDRDPTVRIRAAEAMGEVAAPEFAATLIPLLDDDLGVRRAALASLPSVTGEQLFPGDEFPAPSMSEQVTRWKRWAVERR